MWYNIDIGRPPVLAAGQPGFGSPGSGKALDFPENKKKEID
jgi:hypothetical protein